MAHVVHNAGRPLCKQQLQRSATRAAWLPDNDCVSEHRPTGAVAARSGPLHLSSVTARVRLGYEPRKHWVEALSESLHPCAKTARQRVSPPAAMPKLYSLLPWYEVGMNEVGECKTTPCRHEGTTSPY